MKFPRLPGCHRANHSGVANVEVERKAGSSSQKLHKDEVLSE